MNHTGPDISDIQSDLKSPEQNNKNNTQSAELEPTASTAADLARSLYLHHHDPCGDQADSGIASSEAQKDAADAAAAEPYDDPASYYWDAATMAPLSAISAAAIARLRAYKPPPFPIWDRLPASRRAAVLILLFADRRGDLRVVITMRAASLRSFSGHAAFPGGKADSLAESPYQIARREAWEEIGLPMDDARIPKPFRIEPLCYLPCSLAKTELTVRPCVAFLHTVPDPATGAVTATADESMIPRLDAKEVAAVFSAPLSGFLRAVDEPRRPELGDPPLPDGIFYEGYWSDWNEKPWRVHKFYVPVDNQRVTKPRPARGADSGQAALAEQLDEAPDSRFMVWGMTGRMLVDAARIAYGEEPDFPHNEDYGDEELIGKLEKAGRMFDKKRKEVGQAAIQDQVKDTKI